MESLRVPNRGGSLWFVLGGILLCLSVVVAKVAHGNEGWAGLALIDVLAVAVFPAQSRFSMRSGRYLPLSLVLEWPYSAVTPVGACSGGGGGSSLSFLPAGHTPVR